MGLGRFDVAQCCFCAINTASTRQCSDGWTAIPNAWRTSASGQARYFTARLRGTGPWKVGGIVHSAQWNSVYPQSVRVIGGMVDCDNYVFGEVLQNNFSSSFSSAIGQRVGGIDTYHAWQPFAGTLSGSLWNGGSPSKFLWLYWDGTALIFDGPVGMRLGTRNAIPAGRYFGFGTGPTNACEFDFYPADWTVALQESATEAGCDPLVYQCADGNVPPYLQVEIPACAGCQLAGTYTLPLSSNGLVMNGGDAGAASFGGSITCFWYSLPHSLWAAAGVTSLGVRTFSVSTLGGTAIWIATDPPMPIAGWTSWVDVDFLSGSCGPCGTARVRVS